MSVSFCMLVPLALLTLIGGPLLLALYHSRPRPPRRVQFDDSPPTHKVSLLRPSPKVVTYSTLVTAASLLLFFSLNGTIRFVECGGEDTAFGKALSTPVQKICNCGCSQHRMLAQNGR